MNMTTIRPGIGLLRRSRKLESLSLRSLGRRWESTEPKVSFDDMLSRMSKEYSGRTSQRKNSVTRPRRTVINPSELPEQSDVPRVPSTEAGELQGSTEEGLPEHAGQDQMNGSPEILSGSLNMATKPLPDGMQDTGHTPFETPVENYYPNQERDKEAQLPAKRTRRESTFRTDNSKTETPRGSTLIYTRSPDGTVSTPDYYDSVFLRDCCTCSRCVDPSTRQKNFSTTDIPPNIRPRNIVGGDEDVAIFWENDIPGFDRTHVTHLNQRSLYASIKGRVRPPDTYRRYKQPWLVDDLQPNMIDFDYNEYMSDEVTLFKLLQQLHIYGLAFIKNVPEQESSVSTTAQRIGPLKNTFYGETWDVRSISNAKNVAYTNVNLGFHMDLLYMMQPPRLQLLHCLRASTHGGISLFSDAYRATWDLFKQDRQAFRDLTDIDVNFHYDNDNHHYFQARRTIQLQKHRTRSNLKSALEAVNWSPPFQAPFRSDAGQNFNKDMRKWHNAARKFNALVESEKSVYKRQMAPGECVIFDNRRVLHARTAFSGGERWLRGAYVDDDPFLSKTRVLWRKYGDQFPWK